MLCSESRKYCQNPRIRLQLAEVGLEPISDWCYRCQESMATPTQEDAHVEGATVLTDCRPQRKVGDSL